MTYDGSNVRCYINGRCAAYFPKTGPIDYGNHGPWLIGGNPISSEYVTGSIDDVRVENVVRDPEYIRTQYESMLFMRYVKTTA